MTEVQLNIVVETLVGRAHILTIFHVTRVVFHAESVHVTDKLFTPAVNQVRVIVHHVVHVAVRQLTVMVDKVHPSLHVPVTVYVLQVNCVHSVVLIVTDGAVESSVKVIHVELEAFHAVSVSKTAIAYILSARAEAV